MAKFCGECGSRLDKDTGLCPKCDKERLHGIRQEKPWRGIVISYLPSLLLAIVFILIIAQKFFSPNDIVPAPSAGMESKSISHAVLRSDYDVQSDSGQAVPSYKVFGSAIDKESIASIKFLNSLASAPKDAWDVSEAGDNSVLAWVTPAGDGGQFDLFIAGDGGVWAPADCTYLFAEYRWMNSLDFNNAFFVRNCRTMRGMFFHDQFVTGLDFRGWDTSSVTDMSEMFLFCSSVEDLDLRNFNTSSVTNMNSMFSRCETIEVLDLSSFDTSSVTDMSGMFSQSWMLRDLNLSSFDTSHTVNMNSTFYSCTSLKKLDLSSFDTSSVRDSLAFLLGGVTLEELTIGPDFDYSILLNDAEILPFMEEDGTINGQPWMTFLYA